MGVIFENRNIENDANALKRTYYRRMVRPGAHLSRVEALKRLFTEGVQGYSLEDFQYHPELDRVWHFWHDRMGKTAQEPLHPLYALIVNRTCAAENTAFLDRNAPVIPFADLMDIRHRDFIDDIGEIVSLCRKNGWEAYVIDYTHPILGFPTVRVIVPPISCLERYLYQGYAIRDHLPPKKGMHLLDFDVPPGWSPTRAAC